MLNKCVISLISVRLTVLITILLNKSYLHYSHALANTNFLTRSGSGLQIGFYLERAGRDYVIFERDGLAGENFETFYAFYVIPFLFPLLDTLQRLVSTVSYRSSGREQYKFRKFSPAIASIKVSIAIIWALFNTRESA